MVEYFGGGILEPIIDLFKAYFWWIIGIVVVLYFVIKTL